MQRQPRRPLDVLQMHIIERDMIRIENYFGYHRADVPRPRIRHRRRDIAAAQQPCHIDISSEILVLDEKRHEHACERRCRDQRAEELALRATAYEQYARVMRTKRFGA